MIKLNDYDELISIGSQCNPGLSLRKLGLKKSSWGLFKGCRKNFTSWRAQKCFFYFVKKGLRIYFVSADYIHWL